MFVRSISAFAAWAALSAARPAEASCFDGVRDGPESDVDCGGDCPACERGQWCRFPRDCYSGRCAESVCEEQLREGDEPVPKGYVVERSEADGPAIARTIGWVSLGIGFAGAYVAGLTLPGELSWMYAPIVGPWVEVADKDQAFRGLIAMDALLQTVGAGLVVGGLATAGEQFVRNGSQMARTRVRVVPTGSGRGGGLFIVGTF